MATGDFNISDIAYMQPAIDPGEEPPDPETGAPARPARAETFTLADVADMVPVTAEEKPFWGGVGTSVGGAFRKGVEGIKIGAAESSPDDTLLQDYQRQLGEAQRTAAMEGPGGPATAQVKQYEQLIAETQGRIQKFRDTPEVQAKVKEYQGNVDKINAEITAARPEGMGFWKGSAYDAATSVGVMAPSLVLAPITGGATFPLAAIGLQTYFTSYADNRAKNLPPEKASQMAAVDGLTESLTELLPTSRLIRNSGLLKKFLEATITDIPGEIVASYIQTATAAVAELGPNATDEQVKAAIQKAAVDATKGIPATAATTVMAGGAVAGGVTAVQKGAQALSGEKPKRAPRGGAPIPPTEVLEEAPKKKPKPHYKSVAEARAALEAAQKGEKREDDTPEATEGMDEDGGDEGGGGVAPESVPEGSEAFDLNELMNVPPPGTKPQGDVLDFNERKAQRDQDRQDLIDGRMALGETEESARNDTPAPVIDFEKVRQGKLDEEYLRGLDRVKDQINPANSEVEKAKRQADEAWVMGDITSEEHDKLLKDIDEAAVHVGPPVSESEAVKGLEASWNKMVEESGPIEEGDWSKAPAPLGYKTDIPDAHKADYQTLLGWAQDAKSHTITGQLYGPAPQYPTSDPRFEGYGVTEEKSKWHEKALREWAIKGEFAGKRYFAQMERDTKAEKGPQPSKGGTVTEMPHRITALNDQMDKIRERIKKLVLRTKTLDLPEITELVSQWGAILDKLTVTGQEAANMVGHDLLDWMQQAHAITPEQRKTLNKEVEKVEDDFKPKDKAERENGPYSVKPTNEAHSAWGIFKGDKLVEDFTTEETARTTAAYLNSLYKPAAASITDKLPATGSRLFRDLGDINKKALPAWKSILKAAQGVSAKSRKTNKSASAVLPARTILQHLLNSAEGPYKTMLQKLAQFVPADTTIHFQYVKPGEDLYTPPVDKYSFPVNEGVLGGIYISRAYDEKLGNSIYVVINEEAITKPGFTKTIVHELWHAVTADYLYENWDSPLGKRIRTLHAAAVQAVKSFQREMKAEGWDAAQIETMLGGTLGTQKDEVSGGRKLLGKNALYGLTNSLELIAEAESNPRFMMALAKASPRTRGLWSKVKAAYSAIAGAFMEALGFNKADGRLLHEILATTEGIAHAQKAMLETKKQLKANPQGKFQAPPEDWFEGSKVVDENGEPLVLFRGARGGPGGLPENFLQGQPRQKYAAFAATNPYIANTYANPDHRFDESGGITPLYVKAHTIIEFPAIVDRHGRHFDMFKFDEEAMRLQPGEVLVVRNVLDTGPVASTAVDPNKQWQMPGDIYAWGLGTETKPAFPAVKKKENPNADRNRDFVLLAAQQRGNPERAMLRAQNALIQRKPYPESGAALSYAMEHVGDLTHRMAEGYALSPGAQMGLEFVAPKVRTGLRVTENPIDRRRIEEIDPARYPELMDYADAHRNLVVYNLAQKAARDAAVALGQLQMGVAARNLRILQDMIDNGTYEAEAAKYDPYFEMPRPPTKSPAPAVKTPPSVYGKEGQLKDRVAVVRAMTLLTKAANNLPVVKDLTAAVAKYMEQLKRMVAPETLGPKARQGAAILSKWIVDQMRKDASFHSQSAERRAFWEKNIGHAMEFIEAFERGWIPKDPRFRAIAEAYRQWNSDIMAQDIKHGIQYEAVDNYLFHVFEDHAKFAEHMERKFGKRWGDPKFMKERSYDLYSEAVKAGFKLKYKNPEDIMLARQHASDVAHMKIGALAEMKEAGLAWDKKPKHVPTTAWRSPNGDFFYVHTEADAILQNAWNTVSLWSREGLEGVLFKGAMYLKNKIVPIKLSLSLFHFLHVLTINNATGMLRATKGLMLGNVSAGRWLLEMGKAAAYTDLISAPRAGGRIRAIFRGDIPVDQIAPHEALAIQYMVEGGMMPEQSHQYKSGARQAFADALRRARSQPWAIGRAAYEAPFAALDWMQHWMFEKWIPSIKVASYLKEVQTALESDPTLVADQQRRQVVFHNLAKSVDNRHGEMVYKTMFWNKWVKDLAVVNLLSLGWQMGFLREYGGAVGDLKNLATKQGGLPTKIKAGLLDKPLFVSFYTAQSLMYGGLLTWALTGEPPDEWKDYYWPAVGKDDNGKDKRINTMFYSKEFAAIAEHINQDGVVSGLSHTVANKASGIFGLMRQSYTGVDDFGKEYRDPHGTAFEKFVQTMDYVMGDMTPISVGGINRAAGPEGSMLTNPVETLKKAGPGKIIQNLSGFSDAPGYATRGKAEAAIRYSWNKYNSKKQTPFEQAEYSKMMQDLRTFDAAGDTEAYDLQLDKMTAEFELTPGDRKRLRKRLRKNITPEQSMFQSLKWQEQRRLLDAMSEEDREIYLPFSNKAHLRRRYATEEERAQF